MAQINMFSISKGRGDLTPYVSRDQEVIARKHVCLLTTAFWRAEMRQIAFSEVRCARK